MNAEDRKTFEAGMKAIDEMNELGKANIGASLIFILALKSSQPDAVKLDAIREAIDTMSNAYISYLCGLHAEMIADILPTEINDKSLHRLAVGVANLGEALILLAESKKAEGKKSRDRLLNLMELLK